MDAKRLPTLKAIMAENGCDVNAARSIRARMEVEADRAHYRRTGRHTLDVIPAAELARHPELAVRDAPHRGAAHGGGRHDIHKHQIAVKFPHSVWRQIEKAAGPREMTPGEFIRFVVGREVGSVPITPEDSRIIAGRIADAGRRGRMV